MSTPNPVKSEQPDSFIYQQVAENEIDLLEILTLFKRYRWLMVGIVFSVVAATVLIALVLPKVYRAEVIINPPLTKDVEQFNIFDVEFNSANTNKKSQGNYFYEIGEEDVYDKFIRFLNSKQLQYNFFKKNNLFDSLKSEKDTAADEREVFQKEFSKKIELDDLRFINKNKLETISIFLEGADEQLIVGWLNKYVVYVDEYTVQSIVNGIHKKAQLQIDGIEKQIDSLRDVEKSRRLDLIEQYKEAISVADSIGLTNQVSISLAPNNKLIEKLGVTLSLGDIPLYLRGSNALRAELNVLQQRKDDDPFIPDLRDLQQRLAFLSQLNIKVGDIHASNVDQFAFMSDKPVKPKRVLIVVIGFFFGCLMAVFTVLFKNRQETIAQRKEPAARSSIV